MWKKNMVRCEVKKIAYLLLCTAALGICAHGDAQVDLKAAQRAVRLHDYNKAFSLYLQAARADDAEAQYQLANLYDQGKGVGRSESLATEWLQKSAAQQHPAAQYSLAMKLLERDSSQAMSLLNSSAQQQYAPASIYLERLGTAAASDVEQLADQLELWFAAARKNRVDDLQGFANTGVSIDQEDRAGRTALFAATEANSTSAMVWLLKHRANPNHPDRFGTTPSFVAITHHHPDALDLLFAQGANKDQVLSNGDNLLHYAIRRQHADQVSQLIKLGVNPNHSNNDRWTPLDLAEYSQLVGAVQLLKNNGATHGTNWTRQKPQQAVGDIAAHLTTGTAATKLSVLDLAKIVVGGNVALFNQLISNDKSVDTNNHADSAKLVNQRLPDESTLLALAIKSEQTTMIDALLAAGADINLGANGKLTPLHLAVASGRVDIVQKILKAGANPTQVNNAGLDSVGYGIAASKNEACIAIIDWLTANTNRKPNSAAFSRYLIQAAEYGNKPIVEHVASRADAQVTDESGRNALWYAARNKDRDIIALLLKQGVTADKTDAFGKTPFFMAVESDCRACAELLLPYDDVNRTTSSQNTPLMVAARNGNAEMVAWLLEQKADSKARNKQGDSALIEAVKANSITTAKALMAAGASPTRKNKIGLSAVDFAKNNEEMLTVLQSRSVLDLF